MKSLQQYINESKSHKVYYVKYEDGKWTSFPFEKSPMYKNGYTEDTFAVCWTSMKKVDELSKEIEKTTNTKVRARIQTNPPSYLLKDMSNSKELHTSTMQFVIENDKADNLKDEWYLYIY